MPNPLLYLRTILIGSLGGLIGYLLNFPLGWLVGAMLATVPCAMSGIRVPMSWQLRSVMIGIVGLMAGGAFTPDIFERASQWGYSLAGVAVYCFIITGVGLFMCLKVGKLDRSTAALSSAPGGLSEILALGPEYGADMRALSLIHGMRIAVILIAVPLTLAWLSINIGGVPQMDRSIDFSLYIPLKDFAILAACLLIGLIGGKKIRLPGSYITGPLILSAIVHYTGLTSLNPPQLLFILAQIVIGTSVAQFFSGTTIRQVLTSLLVGGGLTVINLGIAVVFAFGFQHWLGVPFLWGMLALVPGGLPEMSLIALAMGIDPAFISIHHLFRVVLVLFLLPIVVPLWAKRPIAGTREPLSSTGAGPATAPSLSNEQTNGDDHEPAPQDR